MRSRPKGVFSDYAVDALVATPAESFYVFSPAAVAHRVQNVEDELFKEVRALLVESVEQFGSHG